MLIISHLPQFPKKHHLTFELLGLLSSFMAFLARFCALETKLGADGPSPPFTHSFLLCPLLHLLPSWTLTAPVLSLLTHITLYIVIAYLILLSP